MTNIKKFITRVISIAIISNLLFSLVATNISLADIKQDSVPAVSSDPITSEVTEISTADNKNSDYTLNQAVNYLSEEECKLSNPFNFGKYNSEQFYAKIEENVDLNSGSLHIGQDILFLKGRNGLNLDLKLIYNSTTANLYEQDYAMDDRYKVEYLVYYYQNGTRINDEPDECSVEFGTKDQAIEFYLDYEYGKWNSSQTALTIVKNRRDEALSYVYDECTNRTTEVTYNEKISNIGVGWNWGFSNIEINDGLYLHLANGSTYKIVTTDESGDSNLYDYPLKDIRLEPSYGSLPDGTSYAYILYYKDGKKEYFNYTGKLVRTVDRFNNIIKFKYDGQNYLESITDTVGRVVSFTYMEGIDDRITTITLNDPEKSNIKLTSKRIPAYPNNFILDSVQNIENITTSFTYKYETTYFNFFEQQSQKVERKNNIFANLETINYPAGASTKFTFKKNTGNLGNCGIQEYYGVDTRADSSNNKTYNYKAYGYSCYNYTGYPDCSDPNKLPVNYAYWTNVIDDSETHTYIFNNKHLTVEEKTQENGSIITNDILYEEYNEYKLPEKITRKKYSKITKGVVTPKIECYDYNEYGDVLFYWNPYAKGDTKNEEYKTSYTYDETYHYLTGKVYKRDKDTTIVEVSIPYPSHTKIDYNKVFEKGVLKKQTKFLYDSYGNVTEERKYKDGFTEYYTTFYNYDDEIRPQFNGLNLTKKTAPNLPNTVVEDYVYNWFGNMSEYTDGNGNTTSYVYDKLGRIKKLTHNVDNTYKEWLYIIDSQENSVTITDENWNSSEFSSYGNKTKYIYDGLGRLTDEQVYDKNKSTGQYEFLTLVHYTYDSEGRLYTEENLTNNCITKYNYFSDDRLDTKITAQNGITIYKEVNKYDDAFDTGLSKLTKEIKGSSNSPTIITNTYIDVMGRVTKQGKVQNEKEYIDTFEYDYIGNKISEKITRAYDEPDNFGPCDYTMKYDYDFAGNIIKTTDIYGAFATSEFDSLGRLKHTADNISNMTSPAAFKASYEYDALGRLTKESIPFQKDPESGKVNYSVKIHQYDNVGNVISEMTSNNISGTALTFKKVDYLYNSRNMLKEVITYKDSKPENSSSQKYTPENYTQFYYDPSGYKIRMYTGLKSELLINGLDNIPNYQIDSDYSTTKYEYDRLGNLSKMIDPLDMEESYSYDYNGNKISEVDRDGNVTTFSYDGLNRITGINVITPDRKGDSNILYTYTLTGNRFSTLNAVNNSKCYYDDLGRLVTQVEGDIVKEYTYDSSNNKKSFILKQNNVVKINTTYDYDKMNRLWKVSENGKLIATYDYDKNGNRKSLTYLNGNLIEYGYNLANKLEWLTNRNSNGSLVSSSKYKYYPDGNQSSKTDTIGSEVMYYTNDGGLGVDIEYYQNEVNYSYDGLGRLESEAITGESPISYTYDDYNNRKTMIHGDITTSYDYDSNNRLKSENKVTGNESIITSYIYDNNGNQTYKGVETLVNSENINEDNITAYILNENAESKDVIISEYDGLNQLVKVSSGNTSANYYYNGDGLRVTKTVNRVTSSQIWDGNQIALELDGSGIITAKYIRGINLIYSSDVNDANKKYYLYNGHGDVIQTISDSGDILKTYNYDAFGNEKDADPNDANPFRYSGEYFDRETSTYYLRARYYDPAIGRFITEDSNLGESKDPLSLNLYTYCYNNPIYYIDPTGFGVSKELGLGGYSGPPSSGSISSGPEPVCQAPRAPIKLSKGTVIAVASTAIKVIKAAKTMLELEQFKDEHLEQIKLKKEGTSSTTNKIPWGNWSDYEKVTVNGQEYAKVGERLYSRHAVDRMQPSGNRYGSSITQAGGDYGRSVAPQYVEDVINSVKPIVQENGNLKYVGGSLEVVTNPQGTVVTIMTK